MFNLVVTFYILIKNIKLTDSDFNYISNGDFY